MDGLPNMYSLADQPKMTGTVWGSASFEGIKTDDVTKKMLPPKIQKKCSPTPPPKSEK